MYILFLEPQLNYIEQVLITRFTYFLKCDEYPKKFFWLIMTVLNITQTVTSTAFTVSFNNMSEVTYSALEP